MLLLGGGLAIILLLSLVSWSPKESAADSAVQSLAALANPSAPISTSPRASIESLRQQTQRQPRDGRSWALLAYAEFDAEAYKKAAEAFEKAVAVSPKIAADPGVLCDWADALGMAQGGTLKGKPSELISRALALRSSHPKALEMAGSAAYEQRQYESAANYWRQLAAQMPAGSDGRRALESGIARAEQLAGISPPGEK